MNILGIRVSPKKIFFSVFNSIENQFKNVETIHIPQALIMPEQLKYVRNTILDLLREYHVQKAGIKITEGNAHPNVVQIQYACKDDKNVYIAMPFYKNGSLKSLMTKRMLTAREIIRYAIQFISGVAHIHSKGLLHLDIKPDNILLSDNDEALLSDFGLADYTRKKMIYTLQSPQSRAFLMPPFSPRHEKGIYTFLRSTPFKHHFHPATQMI